MKSKKEDLKIKLVSTFTKQEQDEALMLAFEYLLLQLPSEFEKQKNENPNKQPN